MDSTGKLVMESILETKAATILQFFAGLPGTLAVTFEERTWSAWLYDLLHSRVDKLVVCNPRKNALLKDGNKSDRIDARKLADLLRGNQLKPVYHGETGVCMLRELSRSYLTIVTDLSRVMNRLKAVYRSWSIPCTGRDVYYTRHRGQWLAKIREAGVRRRAERHYEELDMLQHLRQQARRELLAESRKHAITAVATDSVSRADSSGAGGGPESIQGLNQDHNHDLEVLFKGAATMASVRPGRSRTSNKRRWPKASSRPWRGSRWHARLPPSR
jgi:transposase